MGGAKLRLGTLLIGGTRLQRAVVGFQLLMGCMELTALMTTIDGITDKEEEEDTQQGEEP